MQHEKYIHYKETEEVLYEESDVLKKQAEYSLEHMKYSIDYMDDLTYGLPDMHLEENKRRLYDFLLNELHAGNFIYEEMNIDGIGENKFFTFDKDDRFMVDIKDKDMATITCSIIRAPYTCSRYRYGFDIELKDVLKAYIGYYISFYDTHTEIRKIERFVKERRVEALKRKIDEELKVNKKPKREINKI